jgi:MATE family multidrug resistance protein
MGSFGEFWSAPGGIREVLRLAVPLVISTMSWTVMMFIDRLFLVWHSDVATAAALTAGTAHWAVICLPLGVVGYVNTFVAQYHGAARPERIGLVVWQGMWLALVSWPCILAASLAADALFGGAGHEAAVVPLEIDYFTTLNYGGGAMVASAAISSFFTGRGRVVTVMVVDSLAAAANVVLDYCWIFGRWGFPAMGMTGAAWATNLALGAKLLMYLLLWLRPRHTALYGTWAGCRFDRRLCLRVLRFGFPAGLQYAAEAIAFFLFVQLVATLGVQATAASLLAFNINSLAFMPVLGIGMAVSTLVGQSLGDNNPQRASRAAWAGFWLAVALMLPISAAYVLAPDAILYLHQRHASPSEFAALRGVVVVLLRFVAAYCLFDAMNIIFSSAIKGAGDTQFVLATTIGVSLLAVLLTWLGLRVWQHGLNWCWAVVTLWILLLGGIYLARFLQGKWQTMRVIEPAIAET